jgi:SAM-dependent methyltransferase
MKILNLGCGTKPSTSPEAVNIDWSIYLRMRKNPVLRAMAPLFLKGDRYKRFAALPDNILVHDLSKGIPFASGSVDVVYHSHLLEHLDRHTARALLLEVKRVLKPGGIHRIAVPDFEVLCKNYVRHVAACDADPARAAEHDEFIAAMIDQAVRRESVGTSLQSPLRRRVENLLLGDARKRGETHQWMYDRISLGHLLTSLGYRDPQVHRYDTSQIPDWNSYGLDLDASGNQYMPASLYMEARK